MSMVERVAITIWEANAPKGAPSYDQLDFIDQGRVCSLARAVIRSMMIPTEEMIAAGDSEIPDNIGFGNDARGVYHTMLNAALKED